MISIAIKNFILVILIILIIHVLIKNYMFEVALQKEYFGQDMIATATATVTATSKPNEEVPSSLKNARVDSEVVVKKAQNQNTIIKNKIEQENKYISQALGQYVEGFDEFEKSSNSKQKKVRFEDFDVSSTNKDDELFEFVFEGKNEGSKKAFNEGSKEVSSKKQVEDGTTTSNIVESNSSMYDLTGPLFDDIFGYDKSSTKFSAY